MRLENEPASWGTPGSEGVANEEQRAYWNGEEAEHWLQYEDRYEEMLRPYTRRLLDVVGFDQAEVVLDVGCGCGQTTREAARSVGSGSAFGVDVSRALIARARERAAQEGVANTRFEEADAQTHAFDESAVDVVISRLGMMFFDDLIAAFGNVRRALRPGGRLVSVCWQDIASNDWITVPGAAALQYAHLEQLESSEASGPFALADRDRIAALLRDAGYGDVAIEPASEQLLLGEDATETATFMMSSGPGRRMLDGADPATVASVADAIAEALRNHESPEGIRLGSCAWLFSGRRPTLGA
jgi:SAM-dependent methyltransferase